MAPRKWMLVDQVATVLLVILGVALLLVSAIYVSSYLAILSLGLIFWGLIMLYITPTKHVPLTLLNATMSTAPANIERMLKEAQSTEIGIYLSPDSLPEFNSSLVFVPSIACKQLPKPDEISEKMYSKTRDGIFLTPPGLGLCKLMEQELSISFAKINFGNFKTVLQKALVDDLELASNVEVLSEGKKVTVEVTGNIFTEICEQMKNYPQTHKQIGCLMSSAIACCLAKSSGMLTRINNEITTRNFTKIEYYVEDVFVPPISKIIPKEPSPETSKPQPVLKKEKPGKMK